jgi:predicted DNA-binding transcriptional regulator AlpA
MESLDQMIARAAHDAVAAAFAKIEPQRALHNTIEARTAVAKAIAEIEQHREWLDTRAAATYLGVSTQWLEIARHKGKGPPFSRITRSIRYKRAELDSWMAQRRVEPEAR